MFLFIFFSEKKVFSVKKFFNIKLFFHIKTFFLQIIHIISKTDIFFQKIYIFFFNLGLQQMNNHSWLPEFSDLGPIGLVNSLTHIEPMLHSHLKPNKNLHTVKWVLVITIIYIFLVFRATKIFFIVHSKTET